MKYKVLYSKEALKSLKKLDKQTSRLIISWIVKNLEGTSDPRAHGKALSANRTGQWRYRVGDYRLLAKLEDNKLIILVIAIGHRRDVYK